MTKGVIMDQERFPNNSVIVRYLLLEYPSISYEDLLLKYQQMGFAYNNRPTPESMRNMRSHLKQRYGCAPEDIPRKPNGSLNVSELIRCYVKKNPKAKLGETKKALALDGVQFTSALFGQIIKSNRKKSKVAKSKEDSDLQSSEPRARLEKSDLKLKVQIEPQNNISVQDQYMKMEEILDELVQSAKKLENMELANILRQARREVIVSSR